MTERSAKTEKKTKDEILKQVQNDKENAKGGLPQRKKAKEGLPQPLCGFATTEMLSLHSVMHAKEKSVKTRFRIESGMIKKKQKGFLFFVTLERFLRRVSY
jgi:hypothetical protein